MKLGLIGRGAIAELMLTTLDEQLDRPLRGVVCLCRPGAAARDGHGRASVKCGTMTIVESAEELLAAKPDVVVEAASHDAVRAYGETVLGHGIDLVLSSVGALADDDLHARMRAAAERSGARLHLPGGAMGGIDILAAARLSGIDEVIYTSRKPPLAWRGTPAERMLNLDGLRSETIFYEGSARAAARDYPKNANVAAIIAIAGSGFDRTQVRLVADPSASGNVHEVNVRARCADISFRITGRASPANPKTSLSAGYSIARAVLNRMAAEVI